MPDLLQFVLDLGLTSTLLAAGRQRGIVRFDLTRYPPHWPPLGRSFLESFLAIGESALALATKYRIKIEKKK